MLCTLPRLAHFCLDSDNPCNEHLLKAVATSPSLKALKSLRLLDQSLSKQGLLHLSHSLRLSACLTQLSINFCFLDFKACQVLAKGVQANHSLVKLDLGDNALQSQHLSSLLEVLTHHQYLGLLNLRKNQLDDVFAKQLAQVLSYNEILYKVDISANPVTNVGA